MILQRLRTKSDKRSLHKAIAYSMDTLIPGLYIWVGPFALRLGGSQPEENYSGTLHDFAGIALVLPSYRIYSTYHRSYDP